MGQVVSEQRWGLGTLSTPTAFKGGWGPDPDGRYLVRQIGLVKYSGHRTLAVALAVAPASGDYGAGTQALTRLAEWIGRHVEPEEVSVEQCGGDG